MILPDVNVLIYAFREDTEQHSEYRAWLEEVLSSEALVGISDLVLSSVVRIITHPRIFARPTSLGEAFEYVDFLRRQPTTVLLKPGVNHWKIFSDLCVNSGAKGNLIADAYLGALAIENGAVWITADRDFARFKKLNWQHPLDA